MTYSNIQIYSIYIYIGIYRKDTLCLRPYLFGIDFIPENYPKIILYNGQMSRDIKKYVSIRILLYYYKTPTS